ncbi:MAG: ubiquinol-cytochrome c reductase iron-sulfur subunit [Desulfobacterales bacterium]|nr:ubiquinol-cytochrome c reductase iron-sulfur subunit [Desulfobacterales bacterium]
MNTDNNDHSKISRRGFLQTTVLTSGAAVLVGIPVISYIVAPAMKKATGKWVGFGPAAELQQNTYNMLSYEFMVKDGWQVLPQRGFVWATKNDSGQVKVFSSTCTHLACNVIWREDAQVFECPCHSGRFDASGRPIAGPPTKPLVSLENKIEDGNLLVYLSF